jgi:hypothetical protein
VTFARRIAVVAALSAVGSVAGAQDMPGAVLELKFTPAPRAQLAVWLERADGRFIRTLALTEAVAYRGIGNRPGASQMNSGYRWPYGRREGALPIWASRRAARAGAQPFRRVIFQDRVSEGLASRTSADQSVDAYYCLSFNRDTTRRDALDAVSCASVFTSDKGRFITQADVDNGYAEPWQDPATGTGASMKLPLHSLYPPRMDVTRCSGTSDCHDHADVALYAGHAREVMPEIDAVTMATPPGFTEQSLLVSLPEEWPAGSYAIWVEVHVEGDYNAHYDDRSFPTPRQPSLAWDSWAIDYGYPYRGQPSLAFAVRFDLGDAGDAEYVASLPEGRASWDVWSDDYGALRASTDMTDDPAGVRGSGADRLVRGADGARLTLHVQTLRDLPEPDPEDPDLPDLTGPMLGGPTEPGSAPAGKAPTQPGDGTDAGTIPSGGGDRAPPASDSGGTVIIESPQAGRDGPVGAVRELRLGRHRDELHSHEWVTIRMLAAESVHPLHRYEVRVATEPIVDEATFIRNGRQAKTASVDPEGAVSLMLRADTPAGEVIESEIGDLVAQTHYWVAVRAVDRLNRRGPISVAQIETTRRTFATVSPCFIATAAYGTALASEVRALRRVRDRYLMTHAPGRALVAAYYTLGERLAAELRARAPLRAAARAMLGPLVAAAARLDPGD